MSLDWFEFHTKSFLTDTMRLNTEAKGAYLLLLLDYYEKEGPAEDDDDVLASITSLPIETWRRYRKVIQPLFVVGDGLWRHPTCDKVIRDAHARIAAATEKARNASRARWNKNSTSSPKGNPTSIHEASTKDSSGTPHVEADFGPSVTAPSHSREKLSSDTAKILQYSSNECLEHSSSNTPVNHLSQYTDKEEGANAPSSASELSIGSLLRSDWAPAGETIAAAKAEGVTVDELAAWLDDWRSRCIDAGTRIVDWDAAWAREYHRRMIERAKKKPKPRVTVSKARLTKVPDGWQPNDTHHKIVAERLKQEGRELDIPRCIESFADYIENKRPDWSSADAAFRTWLKSPHRTEFKTNGQAPQRRAPAPGGSSIVDAFDRLDATLAARGRALAEDQPDGEAAVLSLPEE